MKGDKRLETAYMIMKQLLPNGSPDPTFGVDGGKTAGSKRGALDVSFRSNGGFLVAGFKQYSPTGPTDDAALFSYSRTGSIERDFGQGENVDGLNIFGAPRKPSIFFDVDVLENGQILVAGMIRYRLLVVKLHADGTYDRSFGRGGKFAFLPDRKTKWASARAVEVDRKGRVLVVGYASPKSPESKDGYGLTIRLRSNGELDRSFGKNGVVRLYATPNLGVRSTRVYDVQSDAKGGIWVTGSAGRQDRDERRAVAVRLLPNGGKDTRFFRNGVMKIDLGEGSVGTSLIRRGKKMYLSGRYDQGSEERFFLKRFAFKRSLSTVGR